jgi:tellurite resistance protein
MTPAEQQASLRILLAVAQADGRVDFDERRLIEGVTAQLSASASAPRRGDIDPSLELSKIVSDGARALTYRAALAVANIDGKCSAEERAILKRLHDAFGMKDELSVAEADSMDEVRRSLREVGVATDEFMRAIGRAERDGNLTPQRYEQLVDELEQRKRAVLGRLVEPA